MKIYCHLEGGYNRTSRPARVDEGAGEPALSAGSCDMLIEKFKKIYYRQKAEVE